MRSNLLLRLGRCAFLLFPASLCLPIPPASAQESHPWTIQEIFGRSGNDTGSPPQEMAWSPDGKSVTWIAENGDLVELQPPNTHPKTLLPYDKISSLLNANLPERDRDHRGRYGEPAYTWAPDSQHILFDTNGQLWLFDPKNGTGIQIGNSGVQSGDDPKFSPNGQYVSYLHDHNLYVQRPDGSVPPLALTSDHDDTLLNGEVDWVYLEELDVRSNYFWSPDSRQVAYLQMNESKVPEYPLVDWIPVHATVQKQRYPQPGDPNPGVRVGVVGVNGGATRWLRIPLDYGNDYIPRFGWVNPHVVWVEVLSRDQQHLDIWFADTKTGDARRILQQSEPKYFNLTYDVKFVDDHEFFLLSWRDGHTHIYRYGFDSNNPLGQLAQLQNQVESGDYEVSSIQAIDDGTQTLWYLSDQGDPRQEQVWPFSSTAPASVRSPRGSASTKALFPARAARSSTPTPHCWSRPPSPFAAPASPPPAHRAWCVPPSGIPIPSKAIASSLPNLSNSPPPTKPPNSMEPCCCLRAIPRPTAFPSS